MVMTVKKFELPKAERIELHQFYLSDLGNIIYTYASVTETDSNGNTDYLVKCFNLSVAKNRQDYLFKLHYDIYSKIPCDKNYKPLLFSYYEMGIVPELIKQMQDIYVGSHMDIFTNIGQLESSLFLNLP